MHRYIGGFVVTGLIVSVIGGVIWVQTKPETLIAQPTTALHSQSKKIQIKHAQPQSVFKRYVRGEKEIKIGQINYRFYVPDQLIASHLIPTDYWSTFAQQLQLHGSAKNVVIYPTSRQQIGHLTALKLAVAATNDQGTKVTAELPLERRQLVLNQAQDQVITLQQLAENPVILTALKNQIFNDYLRIIQPQPLQLAQIRQNFMQQPLSSWLALKQQHLIFYTRDAKQQIIAVPTSLANIRYFLPSAWGLTPARTLASKQVALTFDDGPNPNTTPQILKILAYNQISATFFMVGNNVTMYPQLANQVVVAGHLVGNHTYDHAQLSTLTAPQMTQEVTATDAAIYAATGSWPTLMRPPYGSIDVLSATIAARPIIQWNVDSEDWRSRDATVILQQIQQQTANGSIILLHDIQPATVTALPNIINYLRQQGYQFVSLADLLGKPLLSQWQYFGTDNQRMVK
ncbi:polysaccharide deacetylase family protein [Loigolactobacillus jiayinensis]|uniref:Polysaccharide deacetylase family protein n=1 Tax=Loigolactobacillus jiayinensis TaxID=2486016 RepID=A0ABW1RH87_9LACO|nr:polysaccharide deacetylase family protein [Loigolactobacillus jiayinensis]